MTRTSDITSFSDFRANLRNHMDRSKSSGRPLFVTRNGQTQAVLLPPDVYDALARQAELFEDSKAIQKSLAEMKADDTRPVATAMTEMRKKLLKLHRPAKRKNAPVK